MPLSYVHLVQLLVDSGTWRHMDPPGFKRVQRALMYRKRPDGETDVHRVLANKEDVMKTRTLALLEKARVIQFFLWCAAQGGGPTMVYV